jgi:hypothetical protein
MPDLTRPCGCSFCRGYSRSVPNDCTNPEQRTADAYDSAVNGSHLTLPRPYRPVHAYANGGRP